MRLGLVAVEVPPSPKFQAREAIVPSLSVELSVKLATRPLVLDTEVNHLPNLTGFLRFGRNLPVVRFTDRINPRASVVPAFVERSEPPRRLPLGKAIISQAWARRRALQAQQAAARQGPDSSPPAAPDASPSPGTTQGDLFSDQQNPRPADEETGVSRPEEAGEHEEVFGPHQPVEPDTEGEGAPISDPPDEDNVVATPVPLLGAVRGTIRVSLASHGRAEGPREKAKPA